MRTQAGTSRRRRRWRRIQRRWAFPMLVVVVAVVAGLVVSQLG